MRWLFVLMLAACGTAVIPGPEDAGVDAGRDAGKPPPDFCDEVRPIVQLYCVATCHGQDVAYPNSPTTFRLDYYQSPDGGLPGIKAMADRIRARVSVAKDHPPSDFPLQPSAIERQLLSDWVLAGAPRGDGGCF